MSVLRNFFRFKSTKSLGLLILFGAFFLFPETVLADSNATTSDSFQDALRGVAGFLAVLVRTMTFVCLFIMDKGMHLMGTELLIGPRAMEAIQPMWMFIRNLTNIAFVGVILFIAVYNLLKNGDGDWSIKSKLPKVIMALIAINFSLTAARVAIEGVNVATVGVLSISDSAIEAKGITNLSEMLNKPVNTKNPSLSADCDDNNKDCKPFSVAINEGLCGGENPAETDYEKKCLLYINPEAAKTKDGTRGFGTGSEFKHNIFLAFGNHFLQLESLPLLAAELPDFLSIVDSVLFSFIMAAAYMVVFVALFTVLLFRVIALWAMMIFSPAIIAAAILGVGGEQGMNEFLKYLIIPLKIGAVFALTFFMMNMMVDYGAEMSTDGSIIKVGAALNQFYGHSGFGILWKIIILIAFWKAAFWALKDTEVQFAVDKIKSGAESVGKFGATYVASEVKIPTIQGQENSASLLSMGSIGRGFSAKKAQLEQEAREPVNKLFGVGTQNANGLESALIKAPAKWEKFDKVLEHGTDAVRELTVSNPKALEAILSPAQIAKIKNGTPAQIREAMAGAARASDSSYVRGIAEKFLDENQFKKSKGGAASGDVDKGVEKRSFVSGEFNIKYDLGSLQSNADDIIKGSGDSATLVTHLENAGALDTNTKKFTKGGKEVSDYADKLVADIFSTDSLKASPADRDDLLKAITAVIEGQATGGTPAKE